MSAAGIHHSPDPYRAAKREHLRARMQLLILQHPEADLLLRHHWPERVPTLKHDGHTADQLAQILAAVRRVESEVGAGWHPDDGPPPVVRQHLEDAVDYPTTTIDEGGKIDVAQLAAHRARFDALFEVEQAVCRQIASEAHTAGRSISVSAHPTVRRWSIARAVIAWAASGRSIDELWLQAGLLATHAQCCDADATLGGLISQFTIEQAERLYEAAGRS